MPYANNPVGRGYCVDLEQASSAPLANIEWSDALVLEPLTQVEPAIVGPYPSSWGLRLMKVWTLDTDAITVHVHPENGLFDQAHPRLSGTQLSAGERLQVTGLGPSLNTSIPRCPIIVSFGVGGCVRTIEPVLEELLFIPNEKIVSLAWKASVQYEYIPNQRRTALMYEVGAS
jgi:hypothetical protein